MIHGFVKVCEMWKEGIKIGYVIALVRFAFVSVLFYMDCASLTLEAKFYYISFSDVLKMSITNESMFIQY